MMTHVRASHSSHANANEDAAGPIERPCILIVDDQQEIRHLIRISLPRTFRIIEARSGAEAIDAMWLEQPHVVILDITLPGGPDGLTLLEMIRREPSFANVRVVIVSARTSSDYHDRAEALAADAFIDKPFSPIRLGQLVRELVRPVDPVTGN